MSFNDINEVLHSIGRRDNIPNLAIGSNGCAGITLADGVSLYFQWNEEHRMLEGWTNPPRGLGYAVVLAISPSAGVGNLKPRVGRQMPTG